MKLRETAEKSPTLRLNPELSKGSDVNKPMTFIH